MFLPLLLVTAGACVGSFLGLVADRVPRGEAILFGRSRCDGCGRVLAIRDLVPVLGWVANRGRCRGCGVAIGLALPALELAAAAVAVWSLAAFDGALAVATALYGWGLLGLAWIDARSGVLPDLLTWPLLAAGLAAGAWLYPQQLAELTLGAGLGFGIFWAIAAVYRRIRGRAGLGDGDAFMLAAIGAWVGWRGLPSVIGIAALAALGFALLRARGRGLSASARLPFGPFLALAGWSVWLVGPIAFF